MMRVHPSHLRPSRLLSAIAISAVFALGYGLTPNLAAAQPEDEDEGMTFEPDDVSKPEPEPTAAPEPEPEPEPSIEPEPDGASSGPRKVDQETKLADTRVAWQDIEVVVRKPFLKVRRMELMPQWGTTMNDNLVRHHQFAGQFNYFLTDVLAVGLEGQYYVKRVRDPFNLVARQARRLPTVNRYNFGAALNFHYVPVYGKFAVLSEHIIHWESFFTAGIGFTQSEVIPRDPANKPFKNFLITPNFGMSMRFFLKKYVTFSVGVRDYAFVDKFEAVGRTEMSADAAQENATSGFINNVIFQAGISVWIPTTFEYTTFR